jgi:hypothetical protein
MMCLYCTINTAVEKQAFHLLYLLYKKSMLLKQHDLLNYISYINLNIETD